MDLDRHAQSRRHDWGDHHPAVVRSRRSGRGALAVAAREPDHAGERAGRSGAVDRPGTHSGGIDYCYEPRNASLATDVVLAGLERFRSSEFGFAEYKSACEEAGEEGTARLYRKIDILNLIGVIAPMLGLLGTVQGMIDAFNTLASTKGAAKPYQLADSISKALVTTFEGLVVAIP